MAAFTITRPRSSTTVAAPVPNGQHPHAQIVAEGGRVLTLPYAPRGATLGGRGARWSTLDRPGRKPLTVRDGDGLATGILELTVARLDHQESVEDLIDAIVAIAEGGQRVTLVNLSQAERGPWRITAVDVAGTMRQQGTNAITRATVTVTLLEASDATPRLGPVSGGKAVVSKLGQKGGTYVVKKGDTLRSIATEVYGDPGEWKVIGKANKIADATAKLKPGRKLKIPAAEKKKPKAGAKLTSGKGT